MEADYSRTALLKFLTYAVSAGLIKDETARSWRVAVSKILVDLSSTEEADVRTIDLDIAFRKFTNRNVGKYKPESLKVYQSRVSSAIQAFAKYISDPAAYKPHGSSAKSKKDEPKRQIVQQTKQIGVNSGNSDITLPTVSAGLSLPFPIRTDFLAQVVVPRDLTTDEAKRLGAFLLTLATDFKPNEGK